MTATAIEHEVFYLQGRYDECRRLLTSPRMNRPQREVIEDEAAEIRAQLERLGIKFLEESA